MTWWQLISTPTTSAGRRRLRQVPDGVVAPLLGASDRATAIASLFGDKAARDLGYPPQGLSERAGFALALHEARQALPCTV
jgi:hypothetical protein